MNQRKSKRITLTVSEREFDTILAALRFWQDDAITPDGIPWNYADIAMAHGDALTEADIDALIERIN